jgi:hypothetical protein
MLEYGIPADDVFGLSVNAAGDIDVAPSITDRRYERTLKL